MLDVSVTAKTKQKQGYAKSDLRVGITLFVGCWMRDDG